MKPRSPFVIILVTLLITLPRPGFAQGESAVPFLLIAPDPRANGWGGVSTAVASQVPMATAVNPGQLGLFSIDNYFAASTYTPKTQWFPELGYDGLTYNVSALNAGINLAREYGVPFPISIGAGYSRIFVTLGTFPIYDRTGRPTTDRFESWERSDAFSLGIGIDYGVRLGLGMNYKKIVSNLSPIGTELGAASGRAEATATDIGLLLDVPVMDLIAMASGKAIVVGQSLSPLMNISVGYARQNRGDPISYAAAALSDPLPRNVTMGISTAFGLVLRTDTRSWNVVTFTLAREAEDLLVVRHADATFDYQSGLGDISFFKHVIQGKLDDAERPVLHKGWQLEVGEAVSVRGGSFKESPYFGGRNYKTIGYGLRLGGIMRLLAMLDPEAGTDRIVGFIASHLDIGYDHAEYITTGPLSGTTFDALSIVIR